MKNIKINSMKLFILVSIFIQCGACSFFPNTKEMPYAAVETPPNLTMENNATNPTAAPEQTPSLQPYSSALPAPESDLISTPDYLIVPNIPAPEHSLGGGIVQDGPFIFDLHLYRNPVFSANPVTPSLYSDLEGIGIYAVWEYQGPDLAGPVTTYWGIDPAISALLSQEKYLQEGVKQGDSDGRNGGLILPQGSQVGDVISVILKVDTTHGTYGTVLIFTLEENADQEFVPTDISVQTLKTDAS